MFKPTPFQDSPMEEGINEVIDPKTGRDVSEVPVNGIENMPVQIVDAGDTTHTGDMGRLGKN